MAASGQWTVESALSTLPERPQQGSETPVPFLHIISQLKSRKREGWRRFQIMDGESIADHMYRMAIITLLCPPSLAAKLDLNKCTRMALIHDMAESLVGDITPIDGVSKPEKSRREVATMDYLTKGLLGNVHGGTSGQMIKDVFQEYEDDQTLEAHYVHDVDKLELLLQMIEYEKAYKGELDLGEFSRVATRIKLDEVKELANQIMRDRRAYWKSISKTPSDPAKISAELEKAQDEYYSK